MIRLYFHIILSTLLLLGNADAFSPHNFVGGTRPNVAVCRIKSTAILMSTGENEEIQEKVWRFVKKSLLTIGSKGATSSHGNSLRQLLEDHTAVKVKVDTRAFDGSLENAFETLRDLAIQNGAPKDIELIQMRASNKMILFGMPGTLEAMNAGTFPPPPPPSPPADDEATDEE